MGFTMSFFIYQFLRCPSGPAREIYINAEDPEYRRVRNRIYAVSLNLIYIHWHGETRVIFYFLSRQGLIIGRIATCHIPPFRVGK